MVKGVLIARIEYFAWKVKSIAREQSLVLSRKISETDTRSTIVVGHHVSIKRLVKAL